MSTTLKTQIECALKKKTIREYLESQGHLPVNCIGKGRYRYLCPLPDHKEEIPSFVVFTESQYENFFCFGCGKGGTILQLISQLEQVSFLQALNKLGGNISISPEEDVKIALSRIKKELSLENEIISDLSQTLLAISWQCLLFLQGVDFDENETHIIDRYYEFLDRHISLVRFDRIEESVEFLPKALSYRKLIFQQKQEEVRRKKFIS